MDNKLTEPVKIRLAYLDNVRSLVIILVIVMHSAVTYSGIGDWYYVEGSMEELSMFELVFFAFGQSFLQAWFMGILFFISAVFAAKAMIKRGPLKFIKERSFRLGLPLLIYVFIISPVIEFIILGNNPENSFSENYILVLTNFRWLGATGPLWFAETLLIFCVFYAVIRKCFPYSIKIKNIVIKNIICTIAVTGIMAFFFRLAFPIDSSFLNLQFSYFASYIVMFTAGILIGENNLLEKITDEKNIKWIGLSLIIGIPVWFFIALFGGAIDGIFYFKGGWHWQSIAYALWESLTAIGFSTGLIAFFRKKINIENKYTGLLKDNAFGMYFIHAPVLITVSLLLKHLVIMPILKFTLVLTITFITSLIFSFLIRKIKPIGILLR